MRPLSIQEYVMDMLISFLAVKDHLNGRRIYEMSSQTINFTQAVIMALGLLGALSLGGYQVIHNEATVGKFTTLLVYWAQLASKLP